MKERPFLVDITVGARGAQFSVPACLKGTRPDGQRGEQLANIFCYAVKY